MNYKLIVAHCKNNGIGINNKLPWLIKSDLYKFSKLTKGSGNNAIVMGKYTWLSIPKIPLKGRDNLILSTTIKLDDSDKISKSFDNIKSLKKYCEEKKYDTVWIIGGYNIYKSFLDDECLNELYITYIDEDFECDTFFPDYKNNNKWKFIKQEIHTLDINKDITLFSTLGNKIYDRVYIRQ
jgi:dihydrofolate reductase